MHCYDPYNIEAGSAILSTFESRLIKDTNFSSRATTRDGRNCTKVFASFNSPERINVFLYLLIWQIRRLWRDRARQGGLSIGACITLMPYIII